jgi:hypothetical protein
MGNLLVCKILNYSKDSNLLRELATMENSIPFEDAVDCCKKFRETNKVRLFSQCWGCVKFCKGNPEKMCFYKPPNNDGCKFVNELYKEITKAST